MIEFYLQNGDGKSVQIMKLNINIGKFDKIGDANHMFDEMAEWE